MRCHSIQGKRKNQKNIFQADKKNCNIKAVARKKSGPKFELTEEQKNDVLEAFQIFDTEGKVRQSSRKIKELKIFS